MRRTQLHRWIGAVLGVFIALHMINHLALFAGTDTHLSVQTLVRPLYRNPVVEPLLVLGFATQIGLGLMLLRQRGWPRRAWARLQMGAGLVLAGFLLQHVTAALMTRWVKPELDTNIFWAASVVSRPESAAYFAPYYALGVMALFAHLAAFIAIRKRRTGLAMGIVIIGAIFAAAFVTRLMGLWGEITLPDAYQAYLDEGWF